MATCKKCGRISEETAKVLSLCAECIRKADNSLLGELQEIHARGRERFGLAGSPPSGPEGGSPLCGNAVQCTLCQNECKIPFGGRGYCGVRRNKDGHLIGGTPREAVVSWYYDPLPTNCVADWVCAGGSCAGQAEGLDRIQPAFGGPEWAYQRGAEHGYMNLAVFYGACTFDCLFCQNWHYRRRSTSSSTHTAAELVESVTAETSCICFFGGDPTCQLPHALAASKLARRQNRQRILRICWETNGSMQPALLQEMMTLSLQSGGCIKFDLKAMDKNIHHALCGVDNGRTLENFAAAAKRISERPEPPPLIASTLLVPGYVDEQEIKAIAFFIAQLDPNIPYALLGFHGDFLMGDLPPTSWQQAERCLATAKAAGLKCVRIGNVHILR